MNRFNLSRDIPVDVEREVRRRCKFCCVRCESSLYQFHHFNPPYAEAKQHVADGITLLCAGCHDYITRGVHSDTEIAELDSKRRQTAPVGNILLSVKPPFVTVFGSVVFRGEGALIVAGNTNILQVTASESGMELSGNLFDDSGQVALVLDRNIIRVKPENWDVRVRGPVITVWSAPGKIALELKIHPPHGIHIRKADMQVREGVLQTDSSGRFTVKTIAGGGIIAAGAIVTDGPLSLKEKQWTIGPTCISMAFDANRFRELSDRGDFDLLIQEITSRQPGSVNIQVVPPSTS